MNVAEFRRRVIVRAGQLNLQIAAAEVDRLQTYYQLLKHWNRRINLTALPLEPIGDDTLDRLFMEPLAAARFVQTSPLTWYDLGSGGGSPAVPLRVLRPNTRLTMVESRAKKAAFLREVARELELADVTVVSMRFEEWLPTPQSAELVTARALRLDDELLSLVRRFMSEDGRLLLFGAKDAMSSFTDIFPKTTRVALGPGLSTLTICSP